ncbi:hypothetical protein CLHUN_05080 [Ruminiclostridium hungatei]|uniref:Uncharacterized protein n=1 Tax=Ruminiclostridium hungatei TaxID=48256 RepID=A0A1V4SQH7_RUMHU|nr:hypothetical protein CLHUN_05080 [Ruminiclostridium hungatei]
MKNGLLPFCRLCYFDGHISRTVYCFQGKNGAMVQESAFIV